MQTKDKGRGTPQNSVVVHCPFYLYQANKSPVVGVYIECMFVPTKLVQLSAITKKP